MARKPPFSGITDHTDEAPDLSRLYRDGHLEEPPSRLDDKILSEARNAVAPPKLSSCPHAFRAAPVALAAVMVLSVTVVLLMSRETGESLHTDPVTVPHAKSTAPTPVAPSDEPLREQPRIARAPGAPESFAKQRSEAATDSTAQESAGAVVLPPAAIQRAETKESRTSIESSDMALRGHIAPSIAAYHADVLAVDVRGAPGAYHLAVTVKSPDTGCGRYADWWEVVSEDGKLLYRRVFDHSHVNEQPFVRTGGPLPIQPETVVWIRAHLHPAGYGGAALKGSAAAGFEKMPLPPTFAPDLARAQPLPPACDF